MDKKNAGVTTIVVVCVMAIIMVLSLGLFLTASVLMKTAGKTAAAEQSRILAVSLSEEIEKQMTGSGSVYESRLEEDSARAENFYSISLWHYIKQNISDGSWPYYEEPGEPVHSRKNAVRTFQMDSSGIAGEIAATVISLYWTPDETGRKPGQLIIKTTVTVKEQTCTITDVYSLKTLGENGYESWKWEHVDKR